MKKVLVTGANGQLAQCIKDAARAYNEISIFFATRQLLDIENETSVSLFFQKNKFDFCINTAAYTNVDKAESERDRAFAVNAEGAKNLAISCQKNKVTLIQISTDYVFDGKKRTPYIELDPTNPINVYGESKLEGERHVAQLCERHFIFRTSWLYSQYRHNFLNTILKYASEKKPLTITTEQTGTPTNANDLAAMLLNLINTDNNQYGLYHFANTGEASWYDFAEAILKHTGQLKGINLAKTNHYRTFAARPKYSVLNTKKLSTDLNIETVNWNLSLQRLLIIKNS